MEIDDVKEFLEDGKETKQERGPVIGDRYDVTADPALDRIVGKIDENSDGLGVEQVSFNFLASQGEPNISVFVNMSADEFEAHFDDNLQSFLREEINAIANDELQDVEFNVPSASIILVL